MKTNKEIIKLMICCTLLLVSRIGVQGQDIDIEEINGIKPLRIGDTIPDAVWDYPVMIVPTLDGVDTITLRKYQKKKTIIIDFWATWCSPCVNSVVKMDTMIRNNAYKNVILVPICAYDSKEFLDAFIVRKKWTIPTLFDDSYLQRILLSRYKEASGIVIISNNKLVAATHSNFISVDDLNQAELDFVNPIRWRSFEELPVEQRIKRIKYMEAYRSN